MDNKHCFLLLEIYSCIYTLYLESVNLLSIYPIIGFRMYHPKIWCLGIDYLKLKEFKDTRSRMVILTSQNLPFPWKQEMNLLCERCLPVPRWREKFLSPETRNLGSKAMLTKLVTPLSFISSSSTPLPLSMLYKLIVPLSKRWLAKPGPGHFFWSSFSNEGSHMHVKIQ